MFRTLCLMVIVFSTFTGNWATAQDEEFSETVVVYPPDRSESESEYVYMFRDEFFEAFPGLINRPLPEIPSLPDNPGDGGQQPEPGPCDDLAKLVQDNQNGIAELEDIYENLQNGMPYITFEEGGKQQVAYLAGTAKHKERIMVVGSWIIDDKQDDDTLIDKWGDCILGNK